ncbi:MAG: hypothetical protein ACRDQ4_13720 [Pseudonocardiaceae bacterium]
MREMKTFLARRDVRLLFGSVPVMALLLLDAQDKLYSGGADLLIFGFMLTTEYQNQPERYKIVIVVALVLVAAVVLRMSNNHYGIVDGVTVGAIFLQQ